MLILYWVLIALMLVGVIGAVVPGIPGTSLILMAIIIWGVVQGSLSSIILPLGVAIAVLLASIGIEFLASYWGAKRAGASKWGQIGAIVGLILGFLGLLPTLPFGGPLLGILVGPLLGAIMGEYLYQRNWRLAVKAGVGIVVGSLIGNLIQGALAIVTLSVFVLTTWSQIAGVY
ncbi:DUF456 domain-containing protein [Gloeocapsopsis dulcis]|uniref:DUF456 domain-containing protein n=1 Tax=Gloeocapsopsis dulcis AAB1 = 1H9 TaxID=1433147 RepID=A0A6N8FYP0_9CHRO|nr:DUF456 family protein [Gloeocapsopsis dulcis]MUL37455.1 hypothetical protein [Gloeocapsopsis dulcis AAB1 = 1H9]WNN87430.1 DUF456 family protein [Gloeocapsopsis dulcis]